MTVSEISSKPYSTHGIAGEPESEIRGQMRELIATVERLQISANGLCDRLAPVQRAWGEQARTPVPPPPEISPLSDQIHSVCIRVGVVADLLEANRRHLAI